MMDDILKMGHLIRRAGFGESYQSLQRRTAIGTEETIRQLLDDAARPDDGSADWILDFSRAADPAGRLRPQALRPWWTYRMVTTDRPLQEKLTLFWHGHFATSASKVNNAELMLQQNRFLRDNALGNWRAILKGMSRDPAMILWLDNNTNYKAHANENYGRELMELFSLGIGNYTENDVKEAARAFTGWNIQGQSFAFRAYEHDTGSKSFLGKAGNFDGDDIVDIILEQPAAAEFLARRMFTFFAYADPEPEVLDPIVGAFRESDLEIRALLEAILHSKAFWSEKAVGTQIKSPVQLVVGSIRALHGGEAAEEQPGEVAMASPSEKTIGRRRLQGPYGPAVQAMKNMGQDLFFPPNVKGWDGGPAWINSATMLERINFASRIVTLLLTRAAGPGLVRTASITSDPEAAVDAILMNLGPLVLPTAVQRELLHTASGSTTGFAAVRPYQRTAGLRLSIALAMQTPQYQLC